MIIGVAILALQINWESIPLKCVWRLVRLTLTIMQTHRPNSALELVLMAHLLQIRHVGFVITNVKPTI